jgi:hypothetical protein
MYPSSTFCWAQAVRQRDLADATVLENVKASALAAALAWEREAIAADRRERSRDRQTAARDAAAALLSPQDDGMELEDDLEDAVAGA